MLPANLRISPEPIQYFALCTALVILSNLGNCKGSFFHAIGCYAGSELRAAPFFSVGYPLQTHGPLAQPNSCVGANMQSYTRKQRFEGLSLKSFCSLQILIFITNYNFNYVC